MFKVDRQGLRPIYYYMSLKYKFSTITEIYNELRE